MSQTISISNFDSPNIKENSKLDADAAIGVTSLTLAYADNFANNDYIYLGRVGSEGGEVRIINSITGAVTVGITVATAKKHSRFDDVTSLFGNQIQVYRAANVTGAQPDDSAFSTYGSPFAIDFDQVSTSYTDATGGSGYWYKYVYWNSTTSTGTALSSSSATRGGDVGNYASIQSIRDKAGISNNRWITDARVDLKRQAAQQLINSKLAGMYTLPFAAPVNPMIAEITRLLAAGWILTDNYGPVNTLNTNEGQAMLDRATNKDGTGLLDRLNTKDLVLTDPATGADLSIPGTGGGVSIWPDATTATYGADEDGTPEPFGFRRSVRY